MADQRPHCAVIIPTHNGAALTETCLDAMLANPPRTCSWTIVVVDDGSSDGTPEALARFGSAIKPVRQYPNGGFARACNAGAGAAGECDYLVFLNNDTVPTEGWLDALVQEAEGSERVAAVGAKLLFPNGQVQHAGVAIGQDRWPHHLYAGFPAEHPAVNQAREVTAATAACLLVRRDEFESLGGFDTAFLNGYEDVDLCLRLRQRGRLTRYCPRSVVFHLESVTRWPSGVAQGRSVGEQLYQERWRSTIPPDDLAHYYEDGLLNVSYGSHYPLTIAVSSDLAVVRRDGAEPAGLERLLAVRSRQVMELLSAQTRRQLQASGRSSLSPNTSGGNTRPELLATGREHQLGDPATQRHLISVVLPVKDGAHHLSELLPAVLSQSISARLEFVAVDSGSGDETVEVLRRFDATVLRVSPDEFNHGLTRNLAAEYARGDVLLFVSQRARPAGDRWLAPLIATLDADATVAAVCSRVLPSLDADVLTRKDGERELSGLPARHRIQIEDWAAYQAMTPEGRRAFLNFHTVSAAIRTDVWRSIPFRKVRTLGEDLLWAREALESGWALVHEPASLVRHSHSYSLSELLARNIEDGIANREIVDRALEREQIAPMIRAIAQDDWRYLRETLGLSGAELEHWQLESALRRVAQIVGQWLGMNHQALPAGMAERISSIAKAQAPATDHSVDAP